MEPNPFDKASRYTAKLDADAFFAWVTRLPAEQLVFREWLDTRAAPPPGNADQTGDMVARVESPAGTEPPWALAVEFQIEPDPLMFGRLMVYLGNFWQAIKPDPERGSRFNIAGVVLNLTGNGRSSQNMRWTEAGFGTELTVLERNLASENADELLAGIEAGRWSRCVLPWVPLMTGGADPGIIERWKALAVAESDSRRRADFAGLARIFASAAGREAVWDAALEGWNVIESKVVNEWIAMGRAEGEARGEAKGRIAQAVALLISILEAKYGRIASDLESQIRGTSDLSKLETWVSLAAITATLDEFHRAAGV